MTAKKKADKDVSKVQAAINAREEAKKGKSGAKG